VFLQFKWIDIAVAQKQGEEKGFSVFLDRKQNCIQVSETTLSPVKQSRLKQNRTVGMKYTENTYTQPEVSKAEKHTQKAVFRENGVVDDTLEQKTRI